VNENLVDLTGIEPVTSSLRILPANTAANSTREHNWRESQGLDAKIASSERQR
jgi:hypothetical protein